MSFLRTWGWMWLATALLTSHAAGERVRLGDEATVAGPEVRLSDFLPAGEEGKIRDEASKVTLGRAPLPGNRREFSRGEVEERLRGWPDLTQALEIPDALRVTRQGFSIKREAIAEAVSKYFAGITGCRVDRTAELTWAATISRKLNPKLEVVGTAQAIARRGLELRLRCVDREDCASFLVYAPAECARARLAGARLQPRKPEPLLVKAGEHAWVTLESKGMKLSLQVVCLEGGARNRRIRVREQDGARVFLAQVTGPRQLSATFGF